MKPFNTMTAIQIASTVIEKLQEQNRISMEALQKTQTDMRRLEKQVTEKDQLLKIMEGKVRQGSNTYLEMSNRQKEISIKHLELQIQKLLKGNEDLERQVYLAKSDICEKCETKFFMGAPADNKPTSKPAVKKGSGKTITAAKQLSETESQRREKMLERIIEHKDKRIFSLTKEVQRLSQVEKELSNKIFRLTKLLPMSHMTTEVLTECLLKEIQSLELQIQYYQEKYDKFDRQKSSVSYSNLFDSKSKTSLEKMNTNEKAYSSSSRKVNRNFNSSSNQKNIAVSAKNVQKDNSSMVSKLHLLYNDVIELKQFFASENEKFFLNISKESLRCDMLKTQWEEIMGRLGEIAEGIQSILQVNSQSVDNKSAGSNDKDNIIVRLQDRLKEALELTTQYENENSELKGTIEMLKNQIQEDRISNQFTQTDVRQSPNKNSPKKTMSCYSVDTQHLRELLEEKQKQLDCVERHLKTYQNLVEPFQGVLKDSLQTNVQQNLNKNTANQEKNIQKNNNGKNSAHQTLSNRNVKEVSMETKLEVAERNIKTLEDVVERLQEVIKSLGEENSKLESEINVSKANIDPNVSLEAKLKDSEEELIKVQSSHKDLENNVHSLEEINLSLRDSLQEVSSKLEQHQLEAEEQHTSLQAKLSKAEECNSTLETNVAHAQNAIEELKDENATLKSTLQTSASRKSMEEQTHVLKLKNELILKEDEIQNLKASLRGIEMKTAEMSFHRSILRQEIEKLCNVLLETSDPNKSTESRKAIYKIAVLQAAKALLDIDEDSNVQSNTNNRGAFNEMSQQVAIYLTEVARIQELLTIKNQQREDLLKEYLDDFIELSSLPGLSHDGQSGLRLLPASSEESLSESSSSVHSTDKNKQTASSESSVHSIHKNKQTAPKNGIHQTGREPQSRQDEQEAKSAAAYLSSRCSELEDLLEKEQQGHLLSKNEIETLKESIANLKGQMGSKGKLTKLLNTLIEMLRSKGCSDEIAMEQLKSDIKWLVGENQKLFEKSTHTQTELCQHKAENARMQNDLDNLRRERGNEKYDYEKANTELRHLREQILNDAASLINNGDIST